VSGSYHNRGFGAADRAVYLICTNIPGEQQIVKEVDVAPGWTSIVPMNIDPNGPDIFRLRQARLADKVSLSQGSP